jgi:hypothetical protein
MQSTMQLASERLTYASSDWQITAIEYRHEELSTPFQRDELSGQRTTTSLTSSTDAMNELTYHGEANFCF